LNEEEAMRRGRQILEKQFASHEEFIFDRLMQVALGGLTCDITIFNGKPHIGVRIVPKFMYGLMYGAGADKMAELLSQIPLSDGTTISVTQIWTINPMPSSFTQAELDDADMSQASKKCGPNGETLREVVSKTYGCATPEEEDKYLRRVIAS
jgi:hypothetical protein